LPWIASSGRHLELPRPPAGRRSGAGRRELLERSAQQRPERHGRVGGRPPPDRDLRRRDDYSTSSASTTTGIQGEDHRYAETIRRYLDQDKPVVNSEFGHSPYRGDRPGHMEFGEVDTGSLALHRIPLAGRLVRTRLKKGSHLRDGGWLQSRQR
jgi:hypothetical protein